MNLDSIRRAVRARGLTPATAIPEASGGRLEEACIRPARVVEGDWLRMISFGVASRGPGRLPISMASSALRYWLMTAAPPLWWLRSQRLCASGWIAGCIQYRKPSAW